MPLWDGFSEEVSCFVTGTGGRSFLARIVIKNILTFSD